MCLDYSAKCASLIDVAQQPALFPECNASVPYSAAVKKFPTFTQIVETVSLPLIPSNAFLPLRSVEIALRSDPNNFTQANDPGYRTICPEGMYVRTPWHENVSLLPHCIILLCTALHCVSITCYKRRMPIPDPLPSQELFRLLKLLSLFSNSTLSSSCLWPCPYPSPSYDVLSLSISFTRIHLY